LWAARGRIEAERGDWHKAAADLGKAIRLGDQEATVWCQHILSLWASGDEANYHRWCERFVKHFGDSKDETVFRNVVWTVALTDGAVPDWRPLLQRAERLSHPRRLLAVLLYRAGQYDAALKRLQEVLEGSPSEFSAHDGLVMALAAQRLGRGEEAKKWLKKAEHIHGDKAKDVKETWEDRLIYETLHREAETRMTGGG
jgi:tetratricopeptide (TPR) repeat protein